MREVPRLPETPTTGEGWDLLRLIIYVACYVLAIVGLVGYLLWKLPRKGDGPGSEGSGTD